MLRRKTRQSQSWLSSFLLFFSNSSIRNENKKVDRLLKIKFLCLDWLLTMKFLIRSHLIDYFQLMIRVSWIFYFQFLLSNFNLLEWRERKTKKQIDFLLREKKSNNWLFLNETMKNQSHSINWKLIETLLFFDDSTSISFCFIFFFLWFLHARSFFSLDSTGSTFEQISLNYSLENQFYHDFRGSF